MKTIAAFLVIACAAAAWSYEPDLSAPAVQQGLRSILQALPRWANVRVRLFSQDGTFYDIEEPSLQVQISGDRDANGTFHFSGRAAGRLLSLTAVPVSKDLREGCDLNGSGIRLEIRRWGNGYSVDGEVENKYVSYNLSRFGETDFSINQGGVNLSTMTSAPRDLTINGSIDLSQFDQRDLALLSAIVAAVTSAP